MQGGGSAVVIFRGIKDARDAKIDGKTSAKLQHTQMIIENQTLCYNKYDTEIFDYILQLEPVLPDLIQPSLICATSEVCIYK